MIEEIYNLRIKSKDLNKDDYYSCPNETIASYNNKKGDIVTETFCCKNKCYNKFIINNFIDEDMWVTNSQYFVRLDY